eukprot:TRINITY_DN66038_c0_g1_i1.p1 TRINITY_DN66038_c0_g1~~TRINITY_DN66038_c0_g1_i1.p1  ORF type:complete len:443 (-),score=76.56 TRINITY_DN66038_c0_g1_i1:243-1571(-)
MRSTMKHQRGIQPGILKIFLHLILVACAVHFTDGTVISTSVRASKVEPTMATLQPTLLQSHDESQDSASPKSESTHVKDRNFEGVLEAEWTTLSQIFQRHYSDMVNGTWLHEGFSLNNALRFSCIFGNALVQLMPMFKVVEWERRGDTSVDDPLPYVGMVFNSANWCLYGVLVLLTTAQPDFITLIDANIVGVFLGLFYVFSYNKSCHRQVQLEVFRRYLMVAFSVALFEAISVILLPRTSSVLVLGVITLCCSFAGAVSVLITVPEVMKRKDASVIPGPMVFINFFTGIAWLCFGILLGDRLVAGTNALNLAITALCAGLKLTYRSADVVQREKVSRDDIEARLQHADAVKSAIRPAVLAAAAAVNNSRGVPFGKRPSESTPLVVHPEGSSLTAAAAGKMFSAPASKPVILRESSQEPAQAFPVPTAASIRGTSSVTKLAV